MIITSLYGMKPIKQTKEHEDKLNAAINLLGDKYLLAHSINKGKNK